MKFKKYQVCGLYFKNLPLSFLLLSRLLHPLFLTLTPLSTPQE